MGRRIATNSLGPRDVFWPVFKNCVTTHPKTAYWIGAIASLHRHLGPFSRHLIGKIEEKIDDLWAGALDPNEIAKAAGANRRRYNASIARPRLGFYASPVATRRLIIHPIGAAAATRGKHEKVHRCADADASDRHRLRA